MRPGGRDRVARGHVLHLDEPRRIGSSGDEAEGALRDDALEKADPLAQYDRHESEGQVVDELRGDELAHDVAAVDVGMADPFALEQRRDGGRGALDEGLSVQWRTRATREDDDALPGVGPDLRSRARSRRWRARRRPRPPSR